MKPRNSVLVLQHAPCEPLGSYQEELDSRGIVAYTVHLDEGEPLPSADPFDAIIAMGGPMSVNDEASFIWLVEEKRLIRRFVRRGKPYWGVCLGAQLLASSLGARVYKGEVAEVGVLPVRILDAARLDPVFSTLPPELLTLQWHSETFDLPEGSVLLASSPACRHQLFRWKRAYGLQFHLECSDDLVRQWGDIPTYAGMLAEVRENHALPQLLTSLSDASEAMRSHALGLFRRWLNLIVTSDTMDRL